MSDYYNTFEDGPGKNISNPMPSVKEVAEFRRKFAAAPKSPAASIHHFKIDLNADPDYRNYPVSAELAQIIERRTAFALAFLESNGPLSASEKQKAIQQTRNSAILNHHIQETLKAQGIDPRSCMVRIFDLRRVNEALSTGTDRHAYSKVDPGYEQKLLQVYGLVTNLVTYVSDLNDVWSPGPADKKAFIVYRKSGLHRLSHSSGLHAFLGDPCVHTVAVFSVHGGCFFGAWNNAHERTAA